MQGGCGNGLVYQYCRLLGGTCSVMPVVEEHDEGVGVTSGLAAAVLGTAGAAVAGPAALVHWDLPLMHARTHACVHMMLSTAGGQVCDRAGDCGGCLV